MLRPERMTVASVICVKQDVEPLLEALSSFGEFHIEESAENTSLLEIQPGNPESGRVTFQRQRFN